MEQVLQHEPMTVEAFLDWDDGTDTRYELIQGVPFAMNPPAAPHARILGPIYDALKARLTPPCAVYFGGGVVAPEDAWNFRVPDLLVSCTPSPGAWVEAPRLLIEVLSPGNRKSDLTRKLAFYRSVPSVEEVLVLWPDQRRTELYQREGDRWSLRDFIGSALLPLRATSEAVPLDEIYAPVGL